MRATDYSSVNTISLLDQPETLKYPFKLLPNGVWGNERGRSSFFIINRKIKSRLKFIGGVAYFFTLIYFLINLLSS